MYLWVAAYLVPTVGAGSGGQSCYSDLGRGEKDQHRVLIGSWGGGGDIELDEQCLSLCLIFCEESASASDHSSNMEACVALQILRLSYLSKLRFELVQCCPEGKCEV